MKTFGTWMVRFALAFGGLFAILTATYTMQGQTLESAAADASLWALAASAIFIGSRYYNDRKQRACAICDDLSKR